MEEEVAAAIHGIDIEREILMALVTAIGIDKCRPSTSLLVDFCSPLDDVTIRKIEKDKK